MLGKWTVASWYFVSCMYALCLALVLLSSLPLYFVGWCLTVERPFHVTKPSLAPSYCTWHTHTGSVLLHMIHPHWAGLTTHDTPTLGPTYCTWHTHTGPDLLHKTHPHLVGRTARDTPTLGPTYCTRHTHTGPVLLHRNTPTLGRSYCTRHTHTGPVLLHRNTPTLGPTYCTWHTHTRPILLHTTHPHWAHMECVMRSKTEPVMVCPHRIHVVRRRTIFEGASTGETVTWERAKPKNETETAPHNSTSCWVSVEFCLQLQLFMTSFPDLYHSCLHPKPSGTSLSLIYVQTYTFLWMDGSRPHKLIRARTVLGLTDFTYKAKWDESITDLRTTYTFLRTHAHTHTHRDNQLRQAGDWSYGWMAVGHTN